MITSAGSSAWNGDVSLSATFAGFGLPAPSIVRIARIATIEAAHAGQIGRLSPVVLRNVDHWLAKNLGF